MNQHQLTMTAGDDRTFIFTVDDEWEGGDFRFIVDGLFTKTGVVGEDDGSGSSTVTVNVASADTEGHRRRSYRYELQLTLEDVVTVRRGLFVLLPELDET